MEVKMNAAFYQSRIPKESKSAPAQKNVPAAEAQRVDWFEKSAEAGALSDSKLESSGHGFIMKDIPPAGELKIQDIRPDGSQAGKMNWEDVENAFKNINLAPDYTHQVDVTVRSTVSLYVAAKHCLAEEYSGEDQKEMLDLRLKQLDSLYESAKKRVVDSYGKYVGSFYDNHTGKGTGDAMKNSLMAAFDQKVMEAESVGSGLLDPKNGYSFDFICVGLQANMIASEEKNDTIESSKDGCTSDSHEYSLKDLKAAALAAKAFDQTDSGQKCRFISDEELGVRMALDYMKLAVKLAETGADQNVIDAFLNAVRSRQCQNMNRNMYDAYQYTIGRYQKTHSIEKAVSQGMEKYVGVRTWHA